MSGMKEARREPSIEEIMASIRRAISAATVAGGEINEDGVAVRNGEIDKTKFVQNPDNDTECRVPDRMGKLDTVDAAWGISSSLLSKTDGTCRSLKDNLPSNPGDGVRLQSVGASLARSIAEAKSISEFISGKRDGISSELIHSERSVRSGEFLPELNRCSDVTPMSRGYDDPSCTAIDVACANTDNSRDVQTVTEGDVTDDPGLGAGCKMSVGTNISEAIIDDESRTRLSAAATDAAVRSSLSSLEQVSLSYKTQTLGDIVSETMRPMLKDWLDCNLPDLVERMVQQEIKRIVSLR